MSDHEEDDSTSSCGEDEEEMIEGHEGEQTLLFFDQNGDPLSADIVNSIMNNVLNEEGEEGEGDIPSRIWGDLSDDPQPVSLEELQMAMTSAGCHWEMTFTAEGENEATQIFSSTNTSATAADGSALPPSI